MGYKRPHLDVQSLSHFDIEMKLLKHSPWEGLVSHQTSALLEEYVFLDFESLVGVPLKLEIVKFRYPILGNLKNRVRLEFCFFYRSGTLVLFC